MGKLVSHIDDRYQPSEATTPDSMVPLPPDSARVPIVSQVALLGTTTEKCHANRSDREVGEKDSTGNFPREMTLGISYVYFISL